jgi:hypothetical protein
MDKEIQFSATILSTGKTSAGIVVPPEIVESMGAGKKPKIFVTLNDFTYRSSIAVMSGDFMIPVSNEVRSESGLKAGETVTVRLRVDAEERLLEIPADFQVALDANPVASERFAQLSYSNKRRYTMPIEAAKAVETRARRIEKSVIDLNS